MKKLLSIISFIFFLNQSFANNIEIGGGIIESYSGEFPVYSNESKKMESYNMPLLFSISSNNLKIQYINYQQIARGKATNTASTAIVKNSIISFNYNGDMPIDKDSLLNYYFGIGLFDSVYEVHYNTLGYTDDFATNIFGNSSSQIDPGLILGVSYKQTIGKTYFGFNLTLIPSKKIKYDYASVNGKYYLSSWDELEEIDVSGNIFYLVTGMNF